MRRNTQQLTVILPNTSHEQHEKHEQISKSCQDPLGPQLLLHFMLNNLQNICSNYRFNNFKESLLCFEIKLKWKNTLCIPKGNSMVGHLHVCLKELGQP